MIRWLRVRGVLVCLALWVGCGSEDLVDGQFTAPEWDYIQTFRRDTLPPPPCNDACRARAELGQALFFDPRLSGEATVGKDSSNGGIANVGETGKISCASCHDPTAWFADRRSKPNASSLGTAWTGRNTPTLVDAAYGDAFSWSGKYTAISGVLELAITSKAAMNSSKDLVRSVVEQLYRDQYNALFDPDLDAGVATDTVFANVATAIGDYETLLISGPAPFDRYAAGDPGAIGDDAKRGLSVFIGRGLCSECHDGPLFTDGAFHNTGVGQRGEHALREDHGRFDITKADEDNGAFRTPSLRGVSETGPYMHAGQLADLAQVIEHYRWGGDAGGYSGTKDVRMVPLDIDDQDAADLAAFLGTLRGPTVDDDLTRPR